MIKSNYRLLMTLNLENRNIGASKSFYSKKKIDDLMNFVTKDFSTKVNFRLKLTLIKL